jgi:hypothetical protein
VCCAYPLALCPSLGDRLVNKLQQICSSLGETALSENAVLWNKLTTIVCIGGQVGDHRTHRSVRRPREDHTTCPSCIAEFGQVLGARGRGGA